MNVSSFHEYFVDKVIDYVNQPDYRCVVKQYENFTTFSHKAAASRTSDNCDNCKCILILSSERHFINYKKCFICNKRYCAYNGCLCGKPHDCAYTFMNKNDNDDDVCNKCRIGTNTNVTLSPLLP